MSTIRECRWALWTVVAFAAASAGCGTSAPESSRGAVSIAVSSSALTSDVAEVIVTVKPGDGPAFPPIVEGLSRSRSAWTTSVTGIPAGPGRLTEVVANDAAHLPLLAGSAKADIVPGQVALMILALGPSGPPAALANSPPVIDFVSASQATVPQGATVRLEALAHDPDPTDTISVQWSATCGVFDDPTRSVVAWRAPAADGWCQITVRVSDSQGSSVSVNLPIAVLTTAG